MLIARWESSRGAHWAELHQDQFGYSYKANNAGGFMGAIESQEAALKAFQARIDSGYFLPDSAKTPMRLVYAT